MIVHPDTPRGKWPLGRMSEIFRGTDGRLRIAKVQVRNKTWKRPITKPWPLEFS